MWKIYKAFRDPERDNTYDGERPGRLRAAIEAVRLTWALRRGCIEGVHVTVDVWDDRCWHEMLNDKIERLENKQSQRVWGNPDITWAPQDELDYEAASRGIDYHPWRP